MSYFKEVDAWLTAVLIGGEENEPAEDWIERVKSQIKEKLLESYRNGVAAGAKKSDDAQEHPAAGLPHGLAQYRRSARAAAHQESDEDHHQGPQSQPAPH